MDALLAAEGFPEWVTSLMYSRWFYAAVGAFFFVVFVCGVVRLFGKNDTLPKTSRPDNLPSASSSDDASLLEAVGKPNGRMRTILLAAGSLHDLPITLPVRLAIQLAESRKCLLIDLDTKRDALAHVFEIACDKNTAARSPVPTPIENLHIWPAHYFTRLRQMDLKSLLASAEKKYDTVLLNAPYLATHPDRGQIIRCADSAIVFGKDKKNVQPLQQLLEAGSCKILKTLNPAAGPLA